MSTLEGEKPQTFVSQSDRSEQEADCFYPAAEFVLVRGSKLHLWANGVHFVEDENGTVQEGQFFVVEDSGMGVTVSEIESVEPSSNSATVRHVLYWNNGELRFPDDIETWTEDEITGEFDRGMGDTSSSTFLRREK